MTETVHQLELRYPEIRFNLVLRATYWSKKPIIFAEFYEQFGVFSDPPDVNGSTSPLYL